MIARNMRPAPLGSKVSREKQRITSARVRKCSKLNRRTRSEWPAPAAFHKLAVVLQLRTGRTGIHAPCCREFLTGIACLSCFSGTKIKWRMALGEVQRGVR